MKQKGKRKKDRDGQHVIVKKNKSFVKSKRIFWKQGTDAKILFSGITEIRMDEFIELIKGWFCLKKLIGLISWPVRPKYIEKFSLQRVC